ncbi:hypothetical protein FRC03_012494 [Tulasnella sp. 419]|nr:hypothetical protein FRC03_012494 [Tulasnella sp. 419]
MSKDHVSNFERSWRPETQGDDSYIKIKFCNRGKEESIKTAWNEVLDELATQTKVIAETGPAYVPQVDFADLQKLTPAEIDKIKRIGSVIVRNVIDDDEVVGYKESLKEYVKANPHVAGFPPNNKQFFEMYWSKAQLQARSHPNLLALNTFLNNLYQADDDSVVDLNQPLSYADRFRIRNPSKIPWGAHGPHILIDPDVQEQALSDGKIQSCAPHLRTSLMAIGVNMIPTRSQDVFEVIRISMVVRTSRILTQSSVFRTWQGWLSMSDTGPGEGTLRVFPDVLLSTAYLVLRPFFRPVDKTLEGDAFLDKSNWVFDISDGSFQGIQALDDGFDGQRLTDEEHPHLRLDSAIVSMPRVKPGDMAFWHCGELTLIPACVSRET